MAQERLAPIVDAFLHHDRPIARPADDSVCRRIGGRMRRLRIGRGLAPLEIDLAFDVAEPLLGVGAHLKNCVTLAWERRAVVSPHIGTLSSPRALAVFERTIEDLQRLYGVRAARIACDAHPGYESTRHALRTGLPVTRVWHHHAHAGALAAEHPHERDWLVFTWDGVGLGADGTLWGGERSPARPGHWSRVASLRPFRLPGGDRVGARTVAHRGFSLLGDGTRASRVAAAIRPVAARVGEPCQCAVVHRGRTTIRRCGSARARCHAHEL